MNERWRLGCSIFLLIVAIGTLASLTRYALRVQHLRTLRDAAATEHAQLQATHQALATQLSATVPPQAVAATVKANLGMRAPNEQPARVLPTPLPPQREDTGVDSEVTTLKPPWYWWWQLFFGPRTP